MKKILTSLLAFCLLVTLSQLKAQTAVDAGFDRFICQGNCVVLNGNYTDIGGTTTYTVEQIPYNQPEFCGGTSVNLSMDDRWTPVITIPFPFTFYGTTYNQCVISANGLVSFDLSKANTVSNWAINQGIPGNQEVLNAIACPYQDIDPSVGGTIGYVVRGISPNRVFEVYWESTPLFSCNPQIITQEILLHEGTNIIETYIQDKSICAGWNGGAAIHGIQNASGTQADVVPGRNFPSQWAATNDAWRFTPSGSSSTPLSWYSNGVQVGTGSYLQVCPTTTTTYTLQGTSPSGLALSDDVIVDVTGVSTFTVTTSQTNNGCFADTSATATVATLGGTGIFSYQWSPISQTNATATGLRSGIYTVFISNSDDFACASEHLFSIAGGAEIVVCASNVIDPTCANPNGGTASVDIFSGSALTFQWNSSPIQTTQSATGLAAGTYTVTASDASSCTATAQVTLEPPTPAPGIFITGDDLICSNETTVFTADNFFGAAGVYTWTGPNGYTSTGPNATVGTAGLYTAVFTDPQGCTSTASLQLNNYAPGTGPCVDCTLYSFSATPAQAVFTGTPVQLQATLTGPPVCNSYSAAPLTYAPIPVPATATTVTLGDDQVSTANPIGFSFNFYCANYTQFYISSNGFITFNATSSAGCCSGQNIPEATDPNELIALAWTDLLPNNGSTISYFTIGTAPNRQLVVDYNSVPLLGGNGAAVTGQIVLNEGSNLIDIISTNVDISTRTLTQGIENIDGSLAAAVPGRNATTWDTTNDAWRFTPEAIYAWSPAAGLSSTSIANPTASPGHATTYIVTVTVGPCTFTDTVEITTTPTCAMTVSAQQTAEGCIGALGGEATAVAINGATPYTYAWPNVQSNPIASGLAAGTLTVTASDAVGCTATATVTITEYPTPVVNAFINTPGVTLDTVYSGGQAVMFVAPADANTTYTWSPVEFLNVVAGSNVTTTPTSVGLITYTVVGESQGCTASDQVELLVMASQSRTANAFTPNGDESNDTFFPAVNGNVVIKSFKVFDRWGHTVHDSSITGWDGTYKGEALPRDSYIYVMTVRYPERSADEILSGDVTLLR